MNVYDQATTDTYTETFPANASRQMASDLVADFVSRQSSGSLMVDFGCGTGEDISLARPQGVNYYGNDLSLEMLVHGQASGVTRSVVCDLGSLPYRDNTFESGMSLWALQYKEGLRSTLGEWNRVLKDDAPLLLIVPHPLYKFVKYSRDYFVEGKQWESGLGIRRFNYYHPFGKYINALIGSGFAIESVDEPQRSEGTKEYFGVPKKNVPHDLIIQARTIK